MSKISDQDVIHAMCSHARFVAGCTACAHRAQSMSALLVQKIDHALETLDAMSDPNDESPCRWCGHGEPRHDQSGGCIECLCSSYRVSRA